MSQLDKPDAGITILGADLLSNALEKINFFREMEVPNEEEIYIYGKKYIIRSESGKITIRAEFNLPSKKQYPFILSLAKELLEVQRKIQEV